MNLSAGVGRTSELIWINQTPNNGSVNRSKLELDSFRSIHRSGIGRFFWNHARGYKYLLLLPSFSILFSPLSNRSKSFQDLSFHSLIPLLLSIITFPSFREDQNPFRIPY